MMLWGFMALVCLNAILLFTVEPVVARLALPLLGGTPGVWNTALVCFQLLLLIGYAYAHALQQWLTTRQQVRVHGIVLLLSLATLPIRLHADGAIPTGGLAIPWLMLVFVKSVGVPFAVLASGAPLLQAWMVRMTRGREVDPYPLYAASNLGSFMALLAYPIVVEPTFTLSAQRTGWSQAYGVLVAALLAVAWWLNRVASRSTGTGQTDTPLLHARSASDAPITVRDRLWWLLASAVPSSLLLGVTAKLSIDVAAIPLLWVVPLALYLLTFVLAFAARPPVPHARWVRLEPFLLIPVLLMDSWGSTLSGLAPVPVHLAVLTVVAMVCHGELARRRPASVHLTEFFLWIAVGGVIGGVFNALLAPLLFRSVLEYPLVLALAGLVRPGLLDRASMPARRWGLADALIPVLVASAMLLGRWLPPFGPSIGTIPMAHFVAAMIASLLLLGAADRPLRFAAALFTYIAVSQLPTMRKQDSPIIASARSYFGVYRIRENPRDSVRELVHGTTVHGEQSLRASDRMEPRTYYHRHGPMGDLFAKTVAGRAGTRRIGVVGLGVGSLACYGRPGESWTFFEIDPEVERLARDPRWFSFLRNCPPTASVTVGDARQTLSAVSAASFDLLVLDAFSSDAIPVHLLTDEAFTRYAQLLAPGGTLAVHISNRHLDLEPVISALAQAGGWVARMRRDDVNDRAELRAGHASSDWVALARRDVDLGGLTADPQWKPLRAPGPRWSDEYSNVLGVLRWR